MRSVTYKNRNGLEIVRRLPDNPAPRKYKIDWTKPLKDPTIRFEKNLYAEARKQECDFCCKWVSVKFVNCPNCKNKLREASDEYKFLVNPLKP